MADKIINLLIVGLADAGSADMRELATTYQRMQSMNFVWWIFCVEYGSKVLFIILTLILATRVSKFNAIYLALAPVHPMAIPDPANIEV